MATTIEVYRGDGDKRGADVIEPLLDDSVLVLRGTQLMNEYAHRKTSLVLETVYREDLRLGDLIESFDVASGEIYRGKITGIRLGISGSQTEMSVTIERPLE